MGQQCRFSSPCHLPAFDILFSFFFFTNSGWGEGFEVTLLMVAVFSAPLRFLCLGEARHRRHRSLDYYAWWKGWGKEDERRPGYDERLSGCRGVGGGKKGLSQASHNKLHVNNSAAWGIIALEPWPPHTRPRECAETAGSPKSSEQQAHLPAKVRDLGRRPPAPRCPELCPGRILPAPLS